MGLHQTFLFKSDSRAEVLSFLRGLSSVARLEEQDGFVVFSELAGQLAFTLDLEISNEGFVSERAGEYFHFLGVFIEGLTGHFGAVTVKDYPS